METVDILFDYMRKNRKTFQLLLGIAIAIFASMTSLKAQNTSGFIYGKVHTRSEVYQGQLRWGKEEAYWNDHFNTSKTESVYDNYKSKNRSSDFDWSLSSIWRDVTSTEHQFSVQFGDIKELINRGDNRVIVVLKNGEEVRVSGSGYNDVGTRITVLDDELGVFKVDWDKIRKIEFMKTPSNLSTILGKPLFGTVETYRKGSFTGYIQWDHDERIGSDKLDGDTRDGDVSIAFDKIRRITKRNNGSDVELKSGREYYLTGSNDVNSSNKGIKVQVEGVGKVDIPWKEFRSVTFQNNHSESGDAYDTYLLSSLRGKVTSYRDQELQGKIIFDVDEEYNIEFVEAKDDDIEYIIPMRHIASIQPKNYNYSIVRLKNGKELLLGDARDVNERNDGLLIFSSSDSRPAHIDWDKIVKIEFE